MWWRRAEINYNIATQIVLDRLYFRLVETRLIYAPVPASKNGFTAIQIVANKEGARMMNTRFTTSG